MNKVIFGYSYPFSDAHRFHYFIDILVNFVQSIMGREMLYYGGWPFLMHVPYLNVSYLRAQREMGKYFEFIASEVDRQVAEFNPQAPMTTFVQAYLHETYSNSGGYLSVDQLHCVVSDFWVAGMETVSILLRWALLYLMRHPEWQARLHAEIDRVVGRDRWAPTYF